MAHTQPRPRVWRVTLAVLALIAALAVACASGGDEPSGRLRVLATTSVIAEFAEVIVGDDAAVELLVPPGVDLHTYDPPVDAAKAISRADVLLVNGCALEGNLVNRSGDSQLAVVGGGEAAAEQQDAARALCDPHRWLSVPFAIGYAERIAAALSAADPAAAPRYAERVGGLIDKLRSLDAELRQTLDAVPEGQRQLVVFHDAFAHFAAEYGFELVASILPTGSGQSPSAGVIADVVSKVRELAVSAVYYEPQFRSLVLPLVAEESGAKLLPLYSIPIPGEVESYAELMRANARSLVDGLGR